MQELNILNSREVKKIRKIMLDTYGYFPKEDYAYLQSDKNKIYLVNKDLAKVDLRKLKVDKMGLYFAEIKDQQIRLSKEGAQLLFNQGKKEVKNVVEFNEEEIKTYFKGEDLKKDLGTENKFVLLKHKEVFGCAKYKNGVILNFLPKIHRGEVIV